MNNPAVQQSTLRIVDPITDSVWAQLVSREPSTLFHSPQWMAVIQNSYGFSFSACVLEEEGRPVGGVPWCQISDVLGSRRVTLPFSDFCDVLAATQEEGRVLAEYAANSGAPWVLRTLARRLPDLELPVARSTLLKWQSIDLGPDTSVLWAGLSSRARNKVRQAENSGVEVRQAVDRQELREWYLLHLRLRKTKYGLLAQPYSFFENIWDAFVEKEQGLLLLAEYEGQVIAGTIFLFWRDGCYYKFSASDPHQLSLRPNNLLLWRGMLEAKDRGFSLLDLGRSNAQQEGLIAFKRAFGATEEDLHSITYGSDDGESEQEEEARRLLQELTGLFVDEKVPDSVTEEAGSLLYRLFT